MFWPCMNNKPSRPQQRFQLTLAMTSGVCPIASKISMEDGMYTSLKYLTVSVSAPGNSILATSSIIFASNSVCTGPGSIRDNLWVERAGKSGVLYHIISWIQILCISVSSQYTDLTLNLSSWTAKLSQKPSMANLEAVQTSLNTTPAQTDTNICSKILQVQGSI